MASELPENALSKLASSVKNIVTGVPLEDNDVDMQETKVDKTVAKSANKTKTLDKTVDKSVDKTVEVDDHATVHKEKTAPVVHEDVKSHEHEKVDTEVDHEIHQDHYHTTIQPVKDKNVLPTKHVYQENEAEREIDHRDDKAKKAAEAEAARIRNEKVVEGTTHSKEIAPTHENQHIHHHIHETIQPVIERETVQQKVVHTTNHIHETEHLKDQHHEATVAPAISMSDFKKDTGAAAVTEDIEFPVSEVNKGVAVHAKKREVAQANVDAEDSKVGKSAKLMDS